MAILVDRNKKTKFPFLSSAEQKYVDAQMENKQDIIRVNQYRRLIFLCPVEQKNSESQMLEFSRLAEQSFSLYFKRKGLKTFLWYTGTTKSRNFWHLPRDWPLLPTGSINIRAHLRKSKIC